MACAKARAKGKLWDSESCERLGVGGRCAVRWGSQKSAGDETRSLSICAHQAGTVAMLGCYYCARYTDEETEAQSNEMPGLGLQSEWEKLSFRLMSDRL